MQEKILKKIKRFALAHKKIRLVTLEGSRANQRAKKDKYQDYDLCFFLKTKKLRKILNLHKNDPIKKASLPKFIKEWGKILFYQAPENFEFYQGDLPKNWVSFLVIFKKGIRIDFKFIPLKELQNYYKFEPLSRMLVDKDRRFKPAKKQNAFCIKKPKQKDFDEVCNEFYFSFAKLEVALLRRQFILANALLGSMRKTLLDMLGFKSSLKSNSKIWLGKENTDILKFLKQKERKIILSSFHTPSLKHIQKTRKKLDRLFSKTSEFIATKSGFKLPSYRKNILKHCRTLRNFKNKKA